IQKILELIFFGTAVEKNVQQTVAAAMTIVTTCNITFRSHPPLSRKPRLSIYTGDVLVTSSNVMLRTLKNGTAALGNHSLREGYIRNGGKEIKLFTSALKAFQCNNRIVVTQKKHLYDFLRGRIIGRLECGRTQLEVSEDLGIALSVISRLWQRFQDDVNVSRCYSTGHSRVTTPNENRYIYIFSSYCQKKQTEHSIRSVSSALFS
ncbi:uncharacterized protein TNCV_2442061, partial [Trichonephila clavipes]